MTIVNYELIHLLKDCSLVFKTPVFLLDHDHKELHHFPEKFEKPSQKLHAITSQFLPYIKKLPYSLHMYSDSFGQHIFLYAFKDPKGNEMFIGVGPFFQEEIGRKQLHKLAEQLENKIEEKELIRYSSQLPVWRGTELNAIKKLLIKCLPSEKDRNRTVTKRNDVYKKQTIPPSLHFSEQLKEQFLEAFMTGNEHMFELYQSYRQHDSRILANADLVRSAKNKTIQLITELELICRREGSSADDLRLLSEFYINFIESKNKLDDIERLDETIIHSFADRLHQSLDMSTYSPLIERAQKYIFQNLSSELSLKSIADQLNVHPGYLSGVFTKEVGLPITHYVNNQLIKEAKELLSITNYSLMDISTILGYNSQSYFTRVFKQLEGLSPSEFRNKYQISESGYADL